MQAQLNFITAALAIMIAAPVAYAAAPITAPILTNIKSDYVEYQSNEQDTKTIFIGNVTITRADIIITGDRFTSSQNKDLIIGEGQVEIIRNNAEEQLLITAGHLEYQPSRKFATLSTNPVISIETKAKTPDLMSISARKITLEIESNHAIAYNSVKIIRNETVITGDHAEYFGAEQRLVVSGSPKLTQGGNIFTGEQIIFNSATNLMTITGNVEGILVDNDNTKSQ